MRRQHNEQVLALHIAQYLQLQYPNVIYRFDLAADMKLTVGQASRNKWLHPKRGYPDLFIAEARGEYHGFYIELKAKAIYQKNGKMYKDEHLEEQAAMLEKLRAKGFKAEFSVNFDATKAIIDEYLTIDWSKPRPLAMKPVEPANTHPF